MEKLASKKEEKEANKSLFLKSKEDKEGLRKRVSLIKRDKSFLRSLEISKISRSWCCLWILVKKEEERGLQK